MGELYSDSSELAVIKQQLSSHPSVVIVGERKAPWVLTENSHSLPYKPPSWQMDFFLAPRVPVQTQDELDMLTKAVFDDFEPGFNHFLWLGMDPKNPTIPSSIRSQLSRGDAFYVSRITFATRDIFTQANFYPDRVFPGLLLMQQSVKEEREINSSVGKEDLFDLWEVVNENLVRMWRSGENLNRRYFGR